MKHRHCLVHETSKQHKETLGEKDSTQIKKVLPKIKFEFTNNQKQII